MGFYCYALICTENAVRIAAMYTSSSNSTAADAGTACSLALGELGWLNNLNGVTTCDSLPLIVTAASAPGPDNAGSSQVTVTYQSSQLIPIPGVLTGRLTITRTAQICVIFHPCHRWPAHQPLQQELHRMPHGRL